MYKKMKLLALLLFIILTLLTSLSFAGNHDSQPSDGYAGKGDEKWKYNINYSANRISIYWATNKESFITGDRVIQIGNTTDVSRTETCGY